jgi:hypothetical protein
MRLRNIEGRIVVVRHANGSENSIPSYFIKSFSISVPAHPYKWLPTNMIFGYKPPVTAVFRVMAVVTHHQ